MLLPPPDHSTTTGTMVRAERRSEHKINAGTAVVQMHIKDSQKEQKQYDNNERFLRSPFCVSFKLGRTVAGVD